MLIGNPIYDTIFKFLMEDPASARRLLSVLLGEDIDSLQFAAQEQVAQESGYPMALFRMDFVAVIRTATGTRKVLIEVQKAKRATDLMRFRNYLGKQYADRIANPLPLVTVYFLGYDLPDLPESVLKVARQVQGVVSGQVYPVQNALIEHLTHDAYIIQVNRLRRPLRSPVERVLSIFDQSLATHEAFFLDFPEQEQPDEAEPLVKRLRLITKDVGLREKLELEYELELEYHLSFGEKDAKIEALGEALTASQQQIALAKQQEEEARKNEAATRQLYHSAVITLSKQAGLSAEQIAIQLGISLEEVRQILGPG